MSEGENKCWTPGFRLLSQPMGVPCEQCGKDDWHPSWKDQNLHDCIHCGHFQQLVLTDAEISKLAAPQSNWEKTDIGNMQFSVVGPPNSWGNSWGHDKWGNQLPVPSFADIISQLSGGHPVTKPKPDFPEYVI
jgi:hypothetical protein